MAIVHVNNGQCAKCGLVFNRYAGFNVGLQAWFMAMQRKFPAFHTCDAGRGRIDQEIYFNRGASKAHYGQSAHNYNMAFDSFFLIDGQYSLDLDSFDAVVALMPESFEWYGRPTAPFQERPHFQIANFDDLKASGVLKLVE